jgi:Queuine tRNA-ribosyltransferase
MKFIFSDSLDMVDPDFDFIEDRNAPNRLPYWDDAYPHELFMNPPYDGMLVSKATVGDHRLKGQYSESQTMRFYRVGVRKFLRLNDPKYESMPIFGDCGAFSYVKDETPPYSPEEIVEFYNSCGFTHGCSVDHIIFDYSENHIGLDGGSEDAKRRFDITLENADTFFKIHQAQHSTFIPLGAVQGWSPQSMAEASRQLCAMGYEYLAVGGLVPLKSSQIHKIIQAIKDVVPPNTKIHLLGFAKADVIGEFVRYNIASFDTTSPLIRAFKEEKRNYYVLNDIGDLSYYTAIRVPQATENTRLLRAAKEGKINQEKMQALETISLRTLRAYDDGKASIDETLEAVLSYNIFLESSLQDNSESRDKLAKKLEPLYRNTLQDRQWKYCECPICKQIGIEVIIFRGSNRNRRRGMHNLFVYHNRIQQLR